MTKKNSTDVVRVCAYSGCDNLLPASKRADAECCSKLCVSRHWRERQHAECSYPGCPNRVHYLGLCIGHYGQQKRGGPLTALAWRRWAKDGSKVCNWCEQDLPLEAFRKRSARESGITSACRECLTIYKKANFYGTTFAEMKALTEGRKQCANQACQRALAASEIQIDHCHETGRVRGLLCKPCNLALGFVNDSPALLRGLANYLELS